MVFVELLKNLKQLGFDLTFKTADLQEIIHTTLANNDTVKIYNLFLYVPIFFPDAETQINFYNSTKSSFTLSFDCWTSGRKTFDAQLEYEIEIGSAQNINSPKYLIVVHQTAARMGVPNKAKNIAVFDNLDVRKCMLKLIG